MLWLESELNILFELKKVNRKVQRVRQSCKPQPTSDTKRKRKRTKKKKKQKKQKNTRKTNKTCTRSTLTSSLLPKRGYFAIS